MDNILLKIHIISACVFVISFIVKAFLVFTGNDGGLEKYMKKMKVPDMVLSMIFLVTGVWLLINMGGLPGWFHPKLTAIVIVIPMAIIGMKKKNKLMIGLAVVLFLYIYGVAETKNPAIFTSKNAAPAETEGGESQVNGAAIYQSNCLQCHGEDGKLKMYSSPDLSLSTLDMKSRIEMITKGKNAMAGFEGRLNEAQIEAVAAYLDELRAQ
ncbi:MAG: SirB2 family protein [Flavobacteriales bacterium]|nr:SirB2 family protein [Flavobacteriales bacterium]